jgi:hypothetical protein
MTTVGIDTMDLINIVHKVCLPEEIREVLSYLLSALDLPMNVKVPLSSVLDNHGLLEGIVRYLN